MAFLPIGVDYGNLTADSAIILTITVNNTAWINMGSSNVVTFRNPTLYRYPMSPQPVPYISSPHPEIVSNWDELQMGESVQRQISDAVEESVILNRPLNPDGDSAIRKLL